MIRHERTRARLAVAGGAALIAAALVALSVPDSRRTPVSVEAVSAERVIPERASRSGQRTVLEEPKVDYQAAVEAEAGAQYLRAVDAENKRLAAIEAERIAAEKKAKAEAAAKAAAKAKAAAASRQTAAAPEPAQGDAYATCLAAAASQKGARAAPNTARWIDLVVKYFPGEIYKTCKVMACESNGNPNAVGPRQPNGTYPQGLMQILGGPFDPEANMALAAKMRASRGWQPWAC